MKDNYKFKLLIKCQIFGALLVDTLMKDTLFYFISIDII